MIPRPTELTAATRGALRRSLPLLAAALFALPTATVGRSAEKSEFQVKRFPYADVSLQESPFLDASKRNAHYLLELDPDRLLHNCLLYAGLKPKGTLYGGWESQGIAGHILGHYLTALSQEYASTGDPVFKKRIDYIVSELALCQNRYGTGYVGCLPPKELQSLEDLKKGIVTAKPWLLNGGWVPWYTEHKIMAGLRDAYELAGNQTAKSVLIKMADWVDDLTKGLTPEQLITMRACEFGGMNEVLTNVYQITGNPHYLDVARRFYDTIVYAPLAAGKDRLNGLHANTQEAKMVGEAVYAEATHSPLDHQIARNFWNDVAGHHTYVIGGNSRSEHFGPPDETGERLGPTTAETCNTYNMLKLTMHLFEWKPEIKYADFYERALYNDILAGEEPRKGMFTYFMSLEPGHFKTFSTPFNSFWCCVGTGMENPTKYNAAIYFHGADSLYVNLFIPSVLDWKGKGVSIAQDTRFPESDSSELTFKAEKPVELTLKIRCPSWAAGPVTFELNGKPIDVAGRPGTYAVIKRTWHSGDRLRIHLPMSLRIEKAPGDAKKIAFFYGPILLAGDFGPVSPSKTIPYARDQMANVKAKPVPVPNLVEATDGKPPVDFLQPVADKPLTFRIDGLGPANGTLLKPFYRLYYDYYNVYWNLDRPSAGTAKTDEAEND